MNNIERKKYLEDIKNNLTIDQVYEFLAEADEEPQMHEDYIINHNFQDNVLQFVFRKN